MNILSGMKTYIVAAVAVLAAIIGLFNGELTLLQTLSAIGLATGLFGDRMILKVREAIAIVVYIGVSRIHGIEAEIIFPTGPHRVIILILVIYF